MIGPPAPPYFLVAPPLPPVTTSSCSTDYHHHHHHHPPPVATTTSISPPPDPPPLPAVTGPPGNATVPLLFLICSSIDHQLRRFETTSTNGQLQMSCRSRDWWCSSGITTSTTTTTIQVPPPPPPPLPTTTCYSYLCSDCRKSRRCKGMNGFSTIETNSTTSCFCRFVVAPI